MRYRNALIYARLSDERADDSLERMVSELHAFALHVGVGVAEVVAEDDVSAWKSGDARKGRWSEVVAGLADGTYDCLVVRSLDRCARDMVETIKLAQLKDQYGFGFYALNGDVLGDQMIAALMGWKNWRESKDKSDRLKLKWADKASRGDYHPGRWRPYGYQYTRNERGVINGIIIDPFEAEIVREVSQRLIAGESGHSIALDLERRCVSSVSGGPWQRMAVIRMVKPVSAGLIYHQGSTYPGNHQAIITEEQFHQVKEALVRGDKPQLGHNTRKHLLAGLLLCSRCGVIMQCNGRVYQCTTKNTRGGVRGCGTVTITKRNVEPLIEQLVVTYLSREQIEVERQVEKNWTPAITAARAEEAEIQASYNAGDISSSQWIAGMKVARRRLAEAEAARTEQLSKLGGTGLLKVSGSDSEARWHDLNLSQKRAVLFELFESFVVRPAKNTSRNFDAGRVEPIWREA